MKSVVLRLFGVSLAHLLLAGCAIPGTASARLYEAPDVAHEPSAFVLGSAEMVNVLFMARYTAFAFAIDGLRVPDGNNRWSVPVALRPGRRTITAEFSAHPYYARADLEIDAHPGDDFVIKYATDVAMPTGRTFCEFWIADAKTEKAVTPVLREKLEKKL